MTHLANRQISRIMGIALRTELLLAAVLAFFVACNSGRATWPVQHSEKASVPSKPGPRVRPLADRKFERTANRLIRGRYLVNGIAECFACHGPSDFKRLGWPPARGKEGSGYPNFTSSGEPGPASPNITPDRETGVGNWTDDMLARAIREGVGHDGHLLDPTVMPYEFYRAMSAEDLASIIVYLRSIPPIRNPLPASKPSDHIVAPFAIPIYAAGSLTGRFHPS